MAVTDKNYHNLLDKILQEGYTYEDPNRKGVNRIEIPSYTFRHEFKDGFPAITTKKLNYKAVVTELIWFLRGDTNIKYLVDNNCNIWNKDAYNYYLKHKKGNLSFEDYIKYIKELSQDSPLIGFGNLGPVYGHQWRSWKSKDYSLAEFEGYDDQEGIIIDQIQRLITNLKEKPLATDHIVNSWNPGDKSEMALPPCHYGFQIVVRPLTEIEQLEFVNPKYKTNKIFMTFGQSKLLYDNLPKYGFELHWQQRSVDTFLGLPFNIASYATLALILEKITGYKALAIQGDLKKVHLYDNSLDAVKEQLSRDVDKYNKCELVISNTNGTYNNIKLFKENELQLNTLLNNLYIEDFKLENYESYPGIRVEMLERNE